MKFKSIFKRINGISCPFFGISWNPDKTSRTKAKQIITFLEDKRVLYNDYSIEVPEHCIHSIMYIRQFLTDKLMEWDDIENLTEHLNIIRAECRKFLDTVQTHRINHRPLCGSIEEWTFFSSLGVLRAAIGLRVAIITSAFGLDISDELAVILPAEKEKINKKKSNEVAPPNQ